MKKNKNIELYFKSFPDSLDQEASLKIKDDTYKFFDYLVKKYINDGPKVKKLTLPNMFPAMSVYHALLSNNVDKDIAFKVIDSTKEKESLKKAKSMSKLFHLFGLYKIYPTMFKKVTQMSFSKEIGFDPEFVVANKKQCKFNMKKCIFCDRCKAEGMPELVPAFCNTDVSLNTNLHKNIIWHRDSTLGLNAPYCDFDVKLKEKGK